jgi:hypothetical protein
MSSYRKYSRSELEGFLRLLDRELAQPVTVTIIGGAAIGLVWNTTHATTDIDLASGGQEALWAAVKRAQRLHPIPVQTVPFVVAPYHYEERRTPYSVYGATRLTILIPERHDLAIMKTGRAEAHDLQAVADVHAREPLDLETLVLRYYDALTQVTGSADDFRVNFLALVERLFGTSAAEQIQARLIDEPPPPLGPN